MVTCRIIWLPEAQRMLKREYLYYKQMGGERVARKQINKILHAAGQLATLPLLGVTEVLLSKEPECFRSLIIGYYKIIYYVQSDVVYVATLFNCKQSADKLIL